eukprot:1713390-Prymnesium_polylepis.2
MVQKHHTCKFPRGAITHHDAHQVKARLKRERGLEGIVCPGQGSVCGWQRMRKGKCKEEFTR